MRDITLEETHYFKFTTVNTSGAPTQLAGTPVVSIYEQNNTTQITAGVTLTVDYDTITGLNDVAVAATAANGYEAGKTYHLVITTGTVDGTSVVGYVVGEFTVQASASYTRLGAPAGASIAADIAAIEAQTDDIGAAGAGLTALPWNAAWDAEVQSEVADALAVYDSPTKAELDAAVAPLALEATLGTPAGVSIAADIAVIEAQTDDIGVAGAGLTAVPWNAAWDAEVQSEVADALLAYDPPTKAELDAAVAPLATQASVNTIDDFLDTEVAAIKAKTDSLTFTVAGSVDANIQQVNDVTLAGDGSATPWGPV